MPAGGSIRRPAPFLEPGAGRGRGLVATRVRTDDHARREPGAGRRNALRAALNADPPAEA